MASMLTSHKDGSLLLAVKVAPGASRDRVVGPYGDSLKIAVTAPPQGGRANAAVCRLIAGALGLAKGDVTLHAGGGSPRKVLRLANVSADRVRTALRLPQAD